jgi:hypothetical protein
LEKKKLALFALAVWRSGHRTRVARFLLAHDTKMRKNVSNAHLLYQMGIKYPKCLKILQIDKKSSNIFQSKVL